ncbi:MAG: NifU family protein [Planctomycetota bacterium]|nr:NifU family protein [Planctomycetota bacterium]
MESPETPDLRTRVQTLLDKAINPAVAMHGGEIILIDVKEDVIYIQMGGGCQGCGAADVTLRAGVERMIKEEIPEVKEVLDTTDHASGANPYYAPAK